MGALVGFAWDLENDLLAGQLVVDGLERLELVVNLLHVLGVEQHLLDFVAADQVSDSLANNLSWEHKVLQDLVVDRSQSSGSRSLLGLSGSSGRLWQDSSLGQENDVAVRELLLQLTGQFGLHLVVPSQRWHRHEDGNSLLTTGNLNL